MRVVSYNIQFGRGRDGRNDLARIAEAVRGADLIALQEVERNWPRPCGPEMDQPAALSALLPGYHWVYGPAFDVDASQLLPNGRIDNRRRQHGVMLLAKGPILSFRPFALPRLDYGDQFNMQMGALEAVVAPGDVPLWVYVAHLGYLEEAERLAQIDYLAQEIARAPDQGGAWSGPSSPLEASWTLDRPAPPMPASAIVLGDFNSQPDSAVYARLTGAMGLVDSRVAAGNSANEGVTYLANADFPSATDKRIDYCFVTTDLAQQVAAAWIDMAADGSDHQPIWVELAL
ncbi:MAG: endonuclease/exonuclease/phosphatase family protein [Pseudomonadota bacterium]